MKIIGFSIPFATNGEGEIQLKYRLDNDDSNTIIVKPLVECAPGEWNTTIELEEPDTVYYGYEYVQQGRVVRCEWGGLSRTLRMNSVNDRYMQYDRWCDSPAGYYMQTGLFRMFADEVPSGDSSGVNWYNRSVTISLYVVGLAKGERPAVAGDAAVLGGWNPEKAPLMHCVAPNLWSMTFDARELWSGRFSFKVITFMPNGAVRWEEGENRVITLPDFEQSTAYHYTLEVLTLGRPTLRLAGTVIPLFSLRSERSWGIGDFGDLKTMADWLALTGQNVLQLLPVNDTTVFGDKGDSYPYNCVSVFALNPIYADIESLPRLADEGRNNYYRGQRTMLNALPTVNYESVFALKMNYLRELFEQEGDAVLATKECRAFVKKQNRWLQPYTIYRFLMAHLRRDISSWGEFDSFNDTTHSRLLNKYPEAERELQFYTYVQYILFKQLSDAHDYANSKRVALKGDIPIGVAPGGVDVWCDREQFNLSVSAGAPPDAFSADGQNWGFPTYNWEQMAADGYEWWRRRLQYMSNFFDAYRIDHILGFFRIWQIPRWAVSGLAGSFSPSRPLTCNEIAASGFSLDKNIHTRAYIDKSTLAELFDEKAHYVRSRYLTPVDDDILTFKDEYITPEALRADLYSMHSPLSYELKEKVLSIFGEVLFFAEEEGYTPRIEASKTLAYKMLNEQNRAAYNRLYEHYFYHRHNMFWFQEGMRKLMPVLSSTPMTACGEDLGMIPDCVPWVMKNLQILSLEIQRMPKVYGQAFARPAEYPYLSVATPSTHDMSTLRGWWCEDADATQHFYNYELGREGVAPAEMSGDIAAQIVRSHLESPSLLALFAWQDYMAMDERLRRENHDDERINVPANRHHVWCYRMHITIEQMMREEAFNEALRGMIAASGRLSE